MAQIEDRHRSIPRTAREALGLPVPPVRAAQLADRLRNGIGKLHGRMAPGFVLVLERMMGLIDNKTLFTAVELGIPDLLLNKPLTASDIATQVGAETDAIDRLLRYLVCRDLFAVTADGRYANNDATEALTESAPVRWRDWVLFFGSDWNTRIFDQLPRRITQSTPASEAAFGAGFFDYINQHNPDAGRIFNGAMAAGARLQSLLFSEAVDLSRYTRVCDVGGGTGEAMIHVLGANPHLRATVFDLPELAVEAQRTLSSTAIADRVEFQGGDFFESVPEGSDLYTLFAIIHDWDDERCVRLLSNIRDAMTPGGRIMVAEKVIPRGNAYDFSKASDMLMLVLGDGGRERTEPEYEALFARAGLRVNKRIVLPSLFDVFELCA
jgi:SAM-dependent methyltransferase